MAKSGQEVVYEGWLTKSPPTKRIWRAKWRRRWFSLKHSGEIPDQFILTYYTDRNCRKLKGSINLDDCEQVDLGLKIDKRNLKFDHVFDIKTPARTYYLAAETESEMKSWVTCICKVCGLKSTSDEEDMQVPENRLDGDVVYCEEEKDDRHDVPNSNNETPPVSPVSTSPYIPISECITGKTPILNAQDFKTLLQQNMKNSLLKSDFNQSNQMYGISQRNYLNYVNDMQDPRFYDSPRLLSPNREEPESKKDKNNSPLQSPTDTESVFTDDDNIGDMNVYVTRKFTKANLNNKNKAEAPPRPPKSAHVAPSTYINLSVQATSVNNKSNEDDEKKTGPVITDDMYDFPRSHQVSEEAVRNMLQKRHCYNNAAPVKIEGQVFRYDISPKPSTSTNQIFKYDLEEGQDEPASPLSQSSSTTAYSNLPSPLLTDSMPPPIVNRDLKPKRKLSDSLSLSSNPEPSSPRGAPSVDRKLKPPTPLQDAHNRKMKTSPTLSLTRKTSSMDEDCRKSSKGGPSPAPHRKYEEEGRRPRAAPSPILHAGRSHESLLSQPEEQIYHYLPGKMQYLDLDLDCGPSTIFTNNSNTMPSKISGANNSNTVYKKVDFEKTEAFNITRNNLEKERKEPVTFTKK